MSEPIHFRPSKSLLALWCLGVLAPALALTALFATLSATAGRNFGAGSLGLGLASGVGIQLLAALLCVAMGVHFFTIRYTVSDTHVVRAAGFLWKVKRSVPLEKITNIDARQGPLERLMGFGQVWIFTPSTGAMWPEERLTGVPDHHAIRDEILARCERAKTGGFPAPPSPAPLSARDAIEGPAIGVLRDISATLKRIEQKLTG